MGVSRDLRWIRCGWVKGAADEKDAQVSGLCNQVDGGAIHRQKIQEGNTKFPRLPHSPGTTWPSSPAQQDLFICLPRRETEYQGQTESKDSGPRAQVNGRLAAPIRLIAPAASPREEALLLVSYLLEAARVRDPQPGRSCLPT